MKAKFVYENISFERGKDPKSTLGIGLEGYLKGKSLREMHHKSSHGERMASELGSEFMSDIDTSKLYYLGRLDAGRISDSPDWALKRLLPYIHILDGNQTSMRETGAGTVLRSFDTPYGKVVFEGQYGFPPYGSAWAEKETVKNLFFDRKINESIRFERGIEPKTAMGLGLVEIELDYHNFILDDDGNPDMDEEDTAYALQELKDSGLQFKFEPSSWGPVLVKLKGTRDKMAPFVAEYLDEPVEDIKNAMYQWDGKDERDFWKLAGY